MRSDARAFSPQARSRSHKMGHETGANNSGKRAALHAEGRLLNLSLSAKQNAIGAWSIVDSPQGRRRVLLELDDDLSAWDLGPAAQTTSDLHDLFSQRLQQAWRARRWLVPPGTDVYRLVNDAADGLPGLVIDAYKDVALIQSYGAAYTPHAEMIADILRRQFGSLRYVQRARHGALAMHPAQWFGPPRPELVVQEQGLRFHVHFGDSLLGTGLFPDQRPQRQRLRQLSRGRRVLNLFAYAGGFSVAAAAGGAAQVDHVDLSRACQRWGAENFSLNGLSPRAHRFIAEDARDWVQRAKKRQQFYDIVVVDPPTFAQGKSAFRVARDLGPLLQNCVDILEKSALLMISANSRALEFDFVAHQGLQAADARGRHAHIIASDGQGEDCPWPQPNSRLRHLSSVWLKIDE